MLAVLMVYLWQKIDGIILALEKLSNMGGVVLFWTVLIAVAAGAISFFTAPASAPISTDGVDVNGQPIPSIASRWKVWLNTLHLKKIAIVGVLMIVIGGVGSSILPTSKQMAGLVVTYAGVSLIQSTEAQKLLDVAKAEVSTWADGKLGALKGVVPANAASK